MLLPSGGETPGAIEALACPESISFSPSPGNYENSQEVTITTPVPGGILHYTLDGRLPEASDPIPTDPIPVHDLAHITVSLWASSDPSSLVCGTVGTFRIGTIPAVFSPSSGPATNGMEVIIQPGSEGSTIHYAFAVATNLPAGVIPDFGQEFYYTDPLKILAPAVASGETAEIHILARTSKPGLPDGLAQAVYSFPCVAAPSFFPMPAATFESQSRWVTISTPTPGATLYYTMDGSAPTEASTLYTQPVLVAPGTNLRVLALKQGLVGTASHAFYNSACAYYTALAATDPAYTQAAAGSCWTIEPVQLPDFQLSQRMENGATILTWPAVWYGAYQPQKSYDLVNWENEGYVIQDLIGTAEFSASVQADQNRTFYRVQATVRQQ